MISFRQLILIIILILIFYPDWMPIYRIVNDKIKKILRDNKFFQKKK